MVRGQEEIYDELSERASAYYASIWASCSRQEKVVLFNVATDGFVNTKDRAVLRRPGLEHLGLGSAAGTIHDAQCTSYSVQVKVLRH